MEGTHHARSHGPGYKLILSLGALGVVYGDIGTSPLYAFREAFAVADGLAIDRANVLGVLSLVFWALIIVVTVKYLLVVMRADNHGEGGILALVATIAPRKLARTGIKWGVVLVGLFGTALLYGDGMITPAISVLSAVEGLEIVAPGLSSWVIPIAVVILVGLFSIQHRGTGTVGGVFGPVMVVWFAVLAALGISHISEEPGVLGAINPLRAAAFISGQPRLSFIALGAIFLVVTGSEALYADMGHFGRGPIRFGWFTLVLPALVLNYFGQGALIIRDPAAIDNPFFRMPPSWGLLPLVILATLATVIASQALISGAFSLTLQAVQMGYLPRVRVDHTSRRQFGQIYIPSVNYLLMVACIALVVAFRSSTNLAAAYGVAVTTTMVITTLLMFALVRERWSWGLPAAIAMTVGFLVVDLTFFGANILKVPAGGWFPLLVGGVVFVLMTTWKRGRELLVARIRRGELSIERFIGSIVANPQQRVEGTAVYMFLEPGVTPPALLTNLRYQGVLHETILLVAVQTHDAPHLPVARRFEVHHLGEDFHQIVLHYGFMDRPQVEADLARLVSKDFGFDPSDATYFLGKETIIPSAKPGMALWREHLYAVAQRNATSAVHFFGIPPDRVFEVGIQVEI